MTKRKGPDCINCGACDVEHSIIVETLCREDDDGTMVHGVGVADEELGVEIVFTTKSEAAALALHKRILKSDNIEFSIWLPENEFEAAMPPIDKSKLN